MIPLSHGIDQFLSSAEGLFVTGEIEPTSTEIAATYATGSPTAGRLIDTGIGVGGTLLASGVAGCGKSCRMVIIPARTEVRGLTQLFRAVSPAELADLAANAGAFRNPVGIEIKYFSESAEGAASYARQAIQAGGHVYQGPSWFSRRQDAR
ncbi:MAG: hypothetical protein CHACPFDD_01257 [Phycisphaerae bacterium]|nr:hypothetical protein [Phycisphaerae bacterium]